MAARAKAGRLSCGWVGEEEEEEEARGSPALTTHPLKCEGLVEGIKESSS